MLDNNNDNDKGRSELPSNDASSQKKIAPLNLSHCLTVLFTPQALFSFNKDPKGYLHVSLNPAGLKIIHYSSSTRHLRFRLLLDDRDPCLALSHSDVEGIEHTFIIPGTDEKQESCRFKLSELVKWLSVSEKNLLSALADLDDSDAVNKRSHINSEEKFPLAIFRYAAIQSGKFSRCALKEKRDEQWQWLTKDRAADFILITHEFKRSYPLMTVQPDDRGRSIFSKGKPLPTVFVPQVGAVLPMSFEFYKKQYTAKEIEKSEVLNWHLNKSMSREDLDTTTVLLNVLNNNVKNKLNNRKLEKAVALFRSRHRPHCVLHVTPALQAMAQEKNLLLSSALKSFKHHEDWPLYLMASSAQTQALFEPDFLAQLIRINQLNPVDFSGTHFPQAGENATGFSGVPRTVADLYEYYRGIQEAIHRPIEKDLLFYTADQTEYGEGLCYHKKFAALGVNLQVFALVDRVKLQAWQHDFQLLAGKDFKEHHAAYCAAVNSEIAEGNLLEQPGNTQPLFSQSEFNGNKIREEIQRLSRSNLSSSIPYFQNQQQQETVSSASVEIRDDQASFLNSQKSILALLGIGDPAGSSTSVHSSDHGVGSSTAGITAALQQSSAACGSEASTSMDSRTGHSVTDKETINTMTQSNDVDSARASIAMSSGGSKEVLGANILKLIANNCAQEKQPNPATLGLNPAFIAQQPRLVQFAIPPSTFRIHKPV